MYPSIAHWPLPKLSLRHQPNNQKHRVQEYELNERGLPQPKKVSRRAQKNAFSR
ncbi:unnamed protein product, partial [Heterosigma akashiwo]